MGHDEEHRVHTGDGWSLRLCRLVPASPPVTPPVLMLHGFGANGFCLLNQRSSSLGRYLAIRGFDVWLLEFRGTQSSKHPNRAQRLGHISVDDKIQRDLPAAIEMVLHESGSAKLDLIGFSLGGTIAYAYLSHFGDDEVRRLIGLAAPLRFTLPRSARAARHLARPSSGTLAPLQRIPFRKFTELGARTKIVFPARSHFNIANMDRSVLLEMMRHGSEDASLTELGQLSQWSDQQRLTSLDGRIDYAARLAEVTCPLLLIGASRDAHVQPDALREVCERMGSTETRLEVVGRQTGARLDYGHTDLLLGARAPSEVFPFLERWLGEPLAENAHVRR